MILINKPETPLLIGYLRGFHQLKECDVQVMLKLLQGKVEFTVRDVLAICLDLSLKNHEREAYNILRRLEKQDLIWKLKESKDIKKKAYYERIRVDTLQKELEEGIENLKAELVNLTESSYYMPEDPRENTKLLATERQIMNKILQLKKNKIDPQIHLRYKSSMTAAQGGDSYRRFMQKLRRYGFDNYSTEKLKDVILWKEGQESFVIFLCKHCKDELKGPKFNFYGLQIANEDLYKCME